MASAQSHPAHTPPLHGNGALRALPVRRRRREVAGEIARYLGAISILVVGAIHAQQYYDAYFYVVPTIGTLFPRQRRRRS